MEFATKVVEPVINFVWDWSVRHVAYIVRYRQNVDELNGSVKDLGLAKERVDHQCDEAEKNLHNIEGTVTEWVRKVDEFETKVEEFSNDEGHTKIGLSNGLFPYLRNRHKLSRQAEEMAENVRKLVDESSKFNEVAYRENVTSNDATLSNAGFVEFGSTKSTLEQIMAKLEDPTVRMIGLYGQGGVGKSTLIKEIAKRARLKKLFNVVAISEITAEPNIQKIQEEISYPLGLRLEGEGENVRADCLRRRLRKEKENTLIILDDLWHKLELNQLGIPIDDDKDALMKVARVDNDALMKVARVDNDAEKSKKENDKRDLNREALKKDKPLGDYKGCKLLLTARAKRVLSEKMEVKLVNIFRVKELDDQDALKLFKKVAGIPDEILMSNSKQEIVKKYCAGLPMAVVTVGRALKDKSESVWKKTLDKLKDQELVEVQNSMEISVRMSYDHLETKELKSIFLLCAQMGHQPLVMDLVKYCFGLGILEGVSLLREARERIQSSIQTLKNSSLMLEESSSYYFKLHDMVRDAALSIAREQNVFPLRNGKLDDWPDLRTCTSISICNSSILGELPEVLNSPQLKFFQIDSDDPSLKIPGRFFARMKKLRILILSGIHLASLPSSIKCLSNLRLLCLERCTLDRNLSIIGELRKLTILSFSGSHIETLPDELGCLDKLQLVDINNCTIKKMIRPNVISRLTCLEELYLRESFIKMVEGETTQSQISFLSELKHLHQLTLVDLSIPHAAVLPKDLLFDKLNDYKIVIGDFRTLSVGDFRMPNKYEAFRSLALQLKDGNDNIHSQKGMKLLFKRVENLLLGELNGVENFNYDLNLDGFPDLKNLSIIDNIHIKYIINSKDLFHPQDVFLKLECLYLCKLRNIEKICCSPVTDVSFTKLKTIKVEMCAHLKNIFSPYMVKFLASLETIDVSECDSLKEIVEIENSDKVEFLKLQSITLQSLPSFTCFYTRGERPSIHQLAEAQTTNRDHIVIPIAEDEPPLFGEMVEMPNLESLNLSSIKLHKIWSKSSASFQNLIKLSVKDCCNLRYLCSLSVASGFKKLKGLFISECPLMEKIFETEGNSPNKVCVFPKLEEIHLSRMNMLTDIWQAEVSADSFSSLVSVHIQECKKLDKIFPSHMEGWFASLDSLKVVDCKSVKVIFEITSQQMDEFGGIETNLQLILIDDLPNLKHVWSIDPVGILNFKKLRSIEFSACYQLRNVFPASVAKDAQKLAYMSIQNCGQMVEIVACEGGSATNNDPLVFPELTHIELSGLRNVKHFYKGRHIVECPKLKKLAVYDCQKLKAFRTETSESTKEEEKAVYSAEKVFPNLEFMKIDFDQAQKCLSSNTVKYRMQRLEELSLISVESAELLCPFLYRMPNLKKLHLTHTDLEHLLKESSVPCLGSVLQLKELVLQYSEIKDLGFERDPILQRLELLSLDGCDKLIKLAPPSVSLAYLTYLEVNSCDGLKNLMASSTAKSLVQLKTMKVIECGGVKEIVTNEGNKEEKVMEIVFDKLVTIELVALTYLTSFCSHKNLVFKFPSLEILIVRECPAMATFTKSDIRAPKLQNIIAVEGEEEANWQWEGDLNATIQKVFNDKVTFTHTKDLYLYGIQQLWNDRHLVQQNNFRNLKSLRAYRCHGLEYVIPSHLLSCFENLEVLVVWNCRKVRTIFNVNEMPGVTKGSRGTTMYGTIRLKVIYLVHLPNLEDVWDKDPEGIIGFQVLQKMTVNYCDSLKSVFPASVAPKDLTKLETVRVLRCPLVKLFSENEKSEGVTQEFVPEEQFLIHIQQATQIPSLTELRFTIGDAFVTWERESAELQFSRLKRFQEESDSAPLYRFLHCMLPTLQKLKFRWCWFEEMFSAERPNADYTKILLHLKRLKLSNMDNLKNIGLEHSWLQPFPHNLQTLQVKSCHSLKNLVPSTVSFSNLTHLAVSGCESLVYLFTSSTAKSLARLKRMQIERCKSLKEIVSEEGGESDEDEEIVFEQLQVLYLEELDQLKCFYPGISTLRFPCLDQVFVMECYLMKTFSPVNKIDHPIKWFSDGTTQHESDLNSALASRFYEKISEFAQTVSDIKLRHNPLLQEIWRGSQPVADLYFSNLHSLTVVQCQFLSHVLPFNLLPFFTKLETLQVENCDNVKTIFDVKCTTQDRPMTTMEPAVFPLKKLTLSELPNLENVWNEDPCQILKMQLLKQVEVENCECLTSVFPASVAKDFVKLEKLVVQHCEGLVEIVAEDNAHPRGANPELMFPCMTSLTLCDLPKLNYFYNSSVQCDMLKTVTHLQPRTEDQICIAKISEFAQTVSDIELRHNPLLQEIWRGSQPVADLYFSNLHSLTVVQCQFLSHLLPFNLLPFFTKLETLQVENCDNVKTIFDVKCTSQDRVLTTTGPALFPLKKLILKQLPNLENVWNEDLCQILKMQLLKHVEVENCECLTSVFPASVAKDFVKLEKLVVQHCEGLVEIVAEDNAHPRGANPELMFPCMTSLTLCDLPKLNYFYNSSVQCDMLKTVTHLQPRTEDQICIAKLTPNLEDLTLGENELKMISRGDFQGNLLLKLKVLTLQNFHVESSDVFPCGFLLQVPNIEKLEVCDGSFKEIFCTQSPTLDDTTLLSHLKVLHLESLKESISIVSENSWIEPFLKNLETLQVTSCSSSKYVVSGTVSFSNLTCLNVNNCNSLLYLFTSSTAKSLAQLKTMEIKTCDSIEEIVSKEGDESREDEIIFQQLNCLNLEYLRNLRRFYKGSLSFPSMEELSVNECNKMKTLCPGTLKADKLFQVEVDWYSHAITLEKDLNSTMREAFLVRIPETARSVSNVELKDSPDLQEIWHGSLPTPHLCFRNLECLIVDGCHFLSKVLPFYLLPFFTKLETLEVRNCDSAKTIFDAKCVTQDRIVTVPLKKLTLSKLPNLENVWNEDPHGILCMQLLQQVYVDNCKSLTSVFPASVAQDLVKFEDLAVQHCERMIVIVAEDNADQKGTKVELTFPCMTSLTLWDLPKFEYEVCIEKLTPNLEHLTLGENELKMIWHGGFQGNLLHKLKVLTLLNFHVEYNAFAYGFLQQIPNVEKLEVSCSFEEIFCLQSPNVDDTVCMLKVLILEVSSCSCLINLAPLYVCFSNLTCLFVFECHRLENLFTSSTAKSLAGLKIMEIKSCETIKEIVCMEGDGSHEDEIIFGKLLYLNLESLPNLTGFCKGSLSFPCLVQLSVINCHNMENLCAGTVNADKLVQVKFEKDSDAVPLETDLNSTIRKTFLAKISESAQSVSYLELRGRPDLHKIWHSSLQIPDLCFCNLHSLIVDGCQFLSTVIPFNVLPFLIKLETLEVRNCDYVKTIFDVKFITQACIITSPLKNLTLSNMPNLDNVWNEDPHGILRMQLLQVYVDNCKCLKSVFPTSVAKDLEKLENLVVQHCEGLMTIVGEDNADPKETNLELTFPSIVLLTLWDLPKFKYFYNCSMQCDMLKTATHVQPHTDNQVCLQKLTPNLERLILGENELKVIEHGEFQGNLLHKLKVLILLNHVESNVFAYGCVEQVTNKDKLEVSRYSFKVIFCYESPNMNDTGPQSQLKILTVESLPEPFQRNLEFLEVSSCSCLINLAPLYVCFSNLTCLFVFECHRLENLFTSSTAKSLAGLKIMEIKNCETIKEIVCVEGDGSHEDQIIFGKLLYLNLESLPNLRSFYKGSLSFPSLVQMSVIKCHNMENLSGGSVNADKLFGVKFEKNSDAIPLEIDINSTIRKALHATAFDYLSSSSSDTEEDGEYDTPNKD